MPHFPKGHSVFRDSNFVQNSSKSKLVCFQGWPPPPPQPPEDGSELHSLIIVTSILCLLWYLDLVIYVVTLIYSAKAISCASCLLLLWYLVNFDPLFSAEILPLSVENFLEFVRVSMYWPWFFIGWAWFVQFDLDFYGLVLISRVWSGFLGLALVSMVWSWLLWTWPGFKRMALISTVWSWFLWICQNFYVLVMIFEDGHDFYSLVLTCMVWSGFVVLALIFINLSGFLCIGYDFY